MGVSVDAHEFVPVNILDRFRKKGRCKRCVLPKSSHPTRGYVKARPYADLSPALADD